MFIIPTRLTLFEVHMATVKMNEISPESTNIARMFDDDDEDDDKLGNDEDE